MLQSAIETRKQGLLSLTAHCLLRSTLLKARPTLIIVLVGRGRFASTRCRTKAASPAADDFVDDNDPFTQSLPQSKSEVLIAYAFKALRLVDRES